MRLGARNIQTLMAYPHKDGVNKMDWGSVHKNLLPMAFYYIEFCEKHGIPVLFTSIIRPMIPGVSKTDIHAKGRAFDVSAHGWTKELRDEFEAEMEKEFRTTAAIAMGTLQPNCVEWHEGTALHGHVQAHA